MKHRDFNCGINKYCPNWVSLNKLEHVPGLGEEGSTGIYGEREEPSAQTTAMCEESKLIPHRIDFKNAPQN